MSQTTPAICLHNPGGPLVGELKMRGPSARDNASPWAVLMGHLKLSKLNEIPHASRAQGRWTSAPAPETPSPTASTPPAPTLWMK
eukprot:8989671-Pyramimonas_sp.AAC.1